MKICKFRLADTHLSEGLVVVIDVIRAFTTAAYAFEKGAKKIFLVGTVDEAFTLHRKHPDALLMGELDGIPIQGFHFGNSPVEISKGNIQGKTLIQRTSSGTQGVVRAQHAERMLVSSFVVAQSTYHRIKDIDPHQVSFIITGRTKGGHEDAALADYLEDKLMQGDVDHRPYIDRVVKSESGQLLLSGKYSHMPKEDLDAVCALDRFPFSMEVFKDDGQLVLKPIDAKGKLWSFSER